MDIYKKMSFAKNGVFIRQVAKLASGTALAQIINIACLPILARIYSPNDFGTFAIFLACVAILTSVSTLKYEYAILDLTRYVTSVFGENLFSIRLLPNLFGLFSLILFYLVLKNWVN